MTNGARQDSHTARAAHGDGLVEQAAALMREQAAAYRRLDSVCAQLVGALAGGTPPAIESVTRAGDAELLRMRARLVQIMGALSAYADARSASPETATLSREIRRTFEAASTELLAAAGEFRRTHGRATALAGGGASFASACIEMCGVPPMTYRAPYARRGEVRSWA
jgi:hypothetical protein